MMPFALLAWPPDWLVGSFAIEFSVKTQQAKNKKLLFACYTKTQNIITSQSHSDGFYFSLVDKRKRKP